MKDKTYKLHNTGRKKKKRIVIAVLVLMIILGSCLGWFAYKPARHVHVSVTPSANSSNYTNVNGKYLFSGTIVLARAVETYANGNYNQPFSGMSTLGTYDASVGDLECPITNNTVSYQTEVNDLIFNCRPQWLPYLKKYFPIINLSSNHLYDQGEDGFNQTVANLTQAGFQTVGNYNPHIESDDCKTVALPVHLQKSSGQAEDGILPVAVCSYNYKILFSPNPGELESIQKWSKIMPVIALLNHGPEYQQVADTQTTNIAHEMIDYGASFVVGNGTHWVQNTEVYKGKLIAYSLGNFIFDQVDYDGRIALNLSVSMSYSTIEMPLAG